ncbi:hypothetical protein [Ovoidimarina sediminis]|uniref:hypothetical protein n=1 Tax=Ovoidimarina sediminis TaxID=3079856 RepID=UPI002910A980|nr:hypothetical protein [Rhodophyticola sp. MJ-SS7]MDU8943277.1 hypothetical protein [Rhodophyticola sp. MJ-SS7]
MDIGTKIALALGVRRAPVTTVPVLQTALPDITAIVALNLMVVDLPSRFSGLGLTFALAPGSPPLPDGLSVSPSGVLSGIATTAAAPVTVVLRASNAEGFADGPLTISVEELSFTASLSGATDNSTHGPSAESLVALTASGGQYNGPLPVTVAYQWSTVEGGPIAGATSAVFTPNAATLDGQTLYCDVTPDIYPARATAALTVRHVPPSAAGTLADEILDLGTGNYTVATSGEFSGQNLRFTVTGGGTTVDATTGVLTIPTDTAIAGAVVTVSATNSGGTAESAFNLTVESSGLLTLGPAGAPKVLSAVPIGSNDSHDAGTTADYLVGPQETFTDLQAAIDQAVLDGAPRTIAIRAGTYRGRHSLAGFQGTIKRYGSERVVLSGAETLTGLVQCSAADADVLGLGLGVNGSPVYKTTIAASAFEASSALGLNIHEMVEGDSVALPIAQERASLSERFYSLYEQEFHTADSFALNASGHIETITHASVIDQYTDAQLLRAQAGLHFGANAVKFFPIVGSNSAGSSITLSTGNGQSGSSRFYSLANLAPALIRGSWAFVDQGATIDIYVYPFDPANVAGGIEYSARKWVFDLPPTMAGHVTLEGLEIYQAGGGALEEGHAMVTAFNSLDKKPHGFTVRQCRLGKCSNPTTGAVAKLQNIDGLTIENVSLVSCPDSFGLDINGGSGSVQSQNLRVSRVYAAEISNASVRCLQQSSPRVEDVVFYRTGRGGHANLMNFYQQSDKVLVQRVQSIECMGYLTWQAASEIYLGFSEIPGSELPQDSRSIQDQNGGTPGPSSGNNYVWNVHCPPSSQEVAANPAQAANFDLGKAARPDLPWGFYNCIIFGGGVNNDYTGSSSLEIARLNNVYSRTAFWQASGNGWFKDPSEVVQTSLTMLYTDPANGDFSAKAGGILQTKAGHDMRQKIVEEIRPLHRDADFNRDLRFVPVDWNNSFVGSEN